MSVVGSFGNDSDRLFLQEDFVNVLLEAQLIVFGQ
jgi:hypothetical protein